MSDIGPTNILPPPRKLFWQDPLRFVMIIGMMIGLIGSVLDRQYWIAGDIGMIGWTLGIAAGIAVTIWKAKWPELKGPDHRRFSIDQSGSRRFC